MTKVVRSYIVVCVLLVGVVLLRVSPVPAQVLTVPAPRTFVGGTQIIANSVGNLTDIDVFTVPAGQNLVITDIIVSNTNTSSSCCARIFTGPSTLAERTGFITVPAGGSVSVNFVTGIAFSAGQIVTVRNGDSAGPLHFTLRGFRYTTP